MRKGMGRAGITVTPVDPGSGLSRTKKNRPSVMGDDQYSIVFGRKCRSSYQDNYSSGLSSAGVSVSLTTCSVGNGSSTVSTVVTGAAGSWTGLDAFFFAVFFFGATLTGADFFGAAFLGAVLPAVFFFATFFAAFLGAAFFTAFLAAFLTSFFAAFFLAIAFFGAAFFAAFFLATDFFATFFAAFFATFLGAGFAFFLEGIRQSFGVND